VSSAAERIQDDGDEALGQFLIALRARGHRGQRLLEAIERAPRADFLKPEHVGFAYQDMSLPLPFGQETGRPLAIVAAVAALEVEPDHAVLEIGTGSGWQTAVLCGVAKAVASIERWRGLAEAADARLQRLGFSNAVVTHDDGLLGMDAAAPFHRIILNGMVAAVPDVLGRQLTPTGVIVAPVLAGAGVMLTRFRRSAEGLAAETLWPIDAAPLRDGAVGGA
jgi:protein-L-isoaspartate(D-aspartate) O-methyltransferase